MSEHSLLYTAADGFEAARRVGGLHGHSFAVRAWAAADRLAPAFPGDEAAALGVRLAEVLGPLRHSLLEDRVEGSADIELVAWLAARVPGTALSLRSAPDRGAAAGARGERLLWQCFRIEAAHRLPHVPAGHQCGRMHGHGFEVVLHARWAPGVGERLAAAWAPLQARLHLSCLNDLAGLENPTSEVLAAWLWARLIEPLPELATVSVHETATAGCRYDGSHYRIWKDTHFESAVRLQRAPPSDARRLLHGHSYRLRLHLEAPLDAVMGWTVDYGDVKACFAPVYARLDHHALHELNGLEDADAASLLHWIRARTEPALPALDAIELHESPTRGAQLAWRHVSRLPF
ncbi:6-carboxytetrahydropterin synthase [Ectothiorhodospiraceae bacterium 2226]|nr:6-carboxytetrahydropterin synthase [Ectothiorhodospiraceae bacterium 2226]